MRLTVSIVIVSRHNPAGLRRCLIAISQLDYEPFEVVIVADRVSCTALRGVPQATHAKLVQFDEANLSAARNLGISAAAGEVIAFLDDKAVPEPTWLTHLITPFGDQDTAAAGGFVRASNGISWRHCAHSVDLAGQTAPVDLTNDEVTIFSPSANRAIQTDASNMAVRRSILVDFDGFDPRFRRYYSEIDLNLRMAARGLCTAVVPHAEVHCAANLPLDRVENGAGWALLLAKHCPPEHIQTAWQRVQAQDRHRTLSQMVRGDLEPRDIRRDATMLDQGYSQGAARAPIKTVIPSQPDMPFQPGAKRRNIQPLILSGRIWFRRRLRRMARLESATGRVVTLVILSPTALFHHVAFTKHGYWEQNGGLFGKSQRTQKAITFWSFRQRVKAESDGLEIVRGLR